ncbi:DUF3383 domain-containing protein [Novacetimonas hansenii]|uniref:DUF3383 domain-containing protein n=1 Tax=Novacetimonas hansenii TaxID=436 RepID=UPI000789B8FB|nr:DUF3383 domain-containing protein [Novacetimonas hansenii]RFO99874.1 hypothetical protein BGC30_11600 [Novacetimonas hansenii]WEQ58548.1 DUF3383 domain-containing protein [Novacetimonas hansenii]CUW48292.1 hypothetical protein ATCC53582_02429 [Novacetimonas hansenii]
MAGIPVSSIVRVTPGVLAAGGGVAFLNALVLSRNAGLPASGVSVFTSAADVAATCGENSVEYDMAQVYFTGYTNAVQTPSTLLMAACPTFADGAQGPVTATATATLSAGAVQAIAVGNGGSGYTTAPSVTVSGGGGSGATATATVAGGVVVAITVGAGGSGYSSVPTVTLSAPAGSTSGATSGTTPGAVMDALVAVNTGWTGFTTAFEPSLADKQAFAQWTAAQGARFWYVPWDTDPQAVVSGTTVAFGAWVAAQDVAGVTPIYADPMVAALALGWMASQDFSTTSGRTTLKFRQNGLITPTVQTAAMASTLAANGYSYYGGYAGSGTDFEFLSDGAVSGPFAWADSYIGQVWLNGSFQRALLGLLLNIGQIPYNADGDVLIAASVQDTINQALAFGLIRAGVTLTAAQQQQVNNAAARTISDTLATRGWYFLPGASTAAATVRAARASPPCQFWYTDGGSVQSISLSSLEVQ